MVNSRENGIRKALQETVYLFPTQFQTLVWPIPRELEFADCFSCMGTRLRRGRRKRRIMVLLAPVSPFQPLRKHNPECFRKADTLLWGSCLISLQAASLHVSAKKATRVCNFILSFQQSSGWGISSFRVIIILTSVKTLAGPAWVTCWSLLEGDQSSW